MTGMVTLVQVEKLAAELPIHDQQRLIEWMSQRLEARQDAMARAEAFLKTCWESPVRPASEMDAGAEITAMREERGDALS